MQCSIVWLARQETWVTTLSSLWTDCKTGVGHHEKLSADKYKKLVNIALNRLIGRVMAYIFMLAGR